MLRPGTGTSTRSQHRRDAARLEAAKEVVLSVEEVQVRVYRCSIELETNRTTVKPIDIVRINVTEKRTTPGRRNTTGFTVERFSTRDRYLELQIENHTRYAAFSRIAVSGGHQALYGTVDSCGLQGTLQVGAKISTNCFFGYCLSSFHERENKR